MHTTIVRAQNVFGFFTTVCFVIAALIAASDLLAPRTPSANVIVKDVQVYFPPLPHKPQTLTYNMQTESEAVPTTTPRKKKNTHTSASPSPPISPHCSHGTRNKSLSTCPLPGRPRIPRMRRLFGIPLSRVQVRITCRI